ncbi:MAG: phosphonate C-P lyase system protein PhnH [Pseudomonadota bacterium]
MNATMEAGFARPAEEAAAAFRAVLDALARPGTRCEVAVETPPRGLSPAAAALLLTLADQDTPVWFAEGAAEAADWVLFHTGAPRARETAAAAFAVGPWDALLPLEAWAAGTPDYPDRSATLIVELSALEGGAAMRLSGPGIAGATEIAPALPAGAAQALAANAAGFPLGVDFFFTAGAGAIGLPRSTRIAP